MSQSTTPDYAVQRTYNDFDQMCEDVRQWNLDFRQLERGLFSSETFQFGSGGVHISEARFCRSLHQRGTPPAGLRTIAFFADSDVRINWRGRDCTGNDLLLFPRGAELDSVSDSSFHVYTCSFPEELLADVGQRAKLDELDQLRRGREVVRCSGESVAQLRRLLGRLVGAMRSVQTILDCGEAGSLMTQELPRRLLCAVAESNETRLPAVAAGRELALRRALSRIEHSAGESISVPELSDAAGVSQRTLQYIFQERFGLTPKAFLLSYRLHMTRRQLRAANPAAAKVADAANCWGFWHMGQFAADYRNHFGELPSQTLRKVAG